MLKYKFIFCLIIFSQSLSIAQTFKAVPDPEQVLLTLRKTSLPTLSIQADFTEEKYLSILNKPKKSAGVFYYKKSSKLRWEQIQPSGYVILFNNDKIRVIEAEKEKKVNSAGPIASRTKDFILGLINGDFQDSKAFQQTVSESTDYYQIILIPENRRLKGIYSTINLVFSKATMRLKEITFNENGGDKSIMRFKNERIDQPIAEDVFVNL